jgi:hypothetical protein
VTGGTGVVGCHTVAGLAEQGYLVPPRWPQALQGWLCPSSPPDGLRRLLARSRAPPWWHDTTQAHQTYLFEDPRRAR